VTASVAMSRSDERDAPTAKSYGCRSLGVLTDLIPSAWRSPAERVGGRQIRHRHLDERLKQAGEAIVYCESRFLLTLTAVLDRASPRARRKRRR
jgi:hypothetical protein